MNFIRLKANMFAEMTYVDGIFLISLFQMFEKNIFVQEAQFSEIIALTDYRRRGWQMLLLLFVG